MRIVIVTAVFPPEPVVSSKLSHDLASALSTTSKLTVLSPRPTRPYGFKFDQPTEIYDFEHIQTDSYTCPQLKFFGRLRETFSFGRHCRRFILRNHADISLVYSNTWPLFAQYFTIRAAKKKGIPVIFHVQDIYPESLSNKMPFGRSLIDVFLMPIDRYNLKNADKIIVISHKMKAYLAKTRRVDADKISVVNNWLDEREFLNAGPGHAEAANGAFTFMYLGNLGPVAGVEMLIDAFAQARMENCRLIIAGSGSMRESLERRAKESKDALIEFRSVPDGKVPEIQRGADVMLLPMKKGAASSSVPSKLIAYMFSKKPILASVDEESDTAVAIRAAECGWISPPEDAAGLSEAMKAVAGRARQELTDFGENGFRFALGNYSKKSNIKKMIDIVNRTMRT